MSTIIKAIFTYFSVFLVIFCTYIALFSQQVEINIKAKLPNASLLQIEGKFTDENISMKHWVFVNNYADVRGIANRIGKLKFFDKQGREVKYKEYSKSEFVVDGTVKRFSYKIDAQVFDNQTSTAHISWISNSQGLLMLNDLLPVFTAGLKQTKVRFDIPSDWQVSTNEQQAARNTFVVNNPENAIFLVGKGWRETQSKIGKTNVKVSISGDWQFNDSEVGKMAGAILKEYGRLFGSVPFKVLHIFLVRFPKKNAFGRWRAETRGTNITILSSPTIFKTQALQRLHEQLRHELFHLWIPNNLNLIGDYAWFYEGFAIYQALKTGVWLGQIRFEDFLDTIGRAYDLDYRRERKVSLIRTSKSRWNGTNSSVYAKGLLVAFLCDVALLKQSRGKKDLADVFQAVHKSHNKNKSKNNANDAILLALRRYKVLDLIVEKYIKGVDKIDLTEALLILGAENTGNVSTASFHLKSKLSRSQKALLKKLGYNRWRRILNRSR